MDQGGLSFAGNYELEIQNKVQLADDRLINGALQHFPLLDRIPALNFLQGQERKLGGSAILYHQGKQVDEGHVIHETVCWDQAA